MEPEPTPPPPLSVGEMLADGAAQATAVIGDNMPLVFGVAIAFIAWNVGKRVLSKI